MRLELRLVLSLRQTVSRSGKSLPVAEEQGMRRRDYTEIGGAGEAFLTTHWSLIDDVRQEKDGDRALIGLLLERYWKPVYCYLRRRGYRNADAKDLTQGFFHEVVLGHELIAKADQTKGRFRSLLLIALNRYLINAHNAETACKRIPPDKLVSLDFVGSADLPEPLATAGPEESFNSAWVSAMLEATLEDVEAKCHEDGLSAHWHIFRDRVLQPILNRTDPPPLERLCEKYGVAEPAKASNMIVTVKRRFQDALRQRLRDSVLSDDGMREELRELRGFFPELAQDGG